MRISNELKDQSRTIWQAIRFLLFGLLGFCFVTECSSVMFTIIYDSPADESVAAVFFPFLLCIGTLMMVFGFGVWRRWDCFWVFLSLHLSFICAVWAYERAEAAGAKMLGPILIIAAGAALAWFMSRRRRQQQLDRKPLEKSEILRRRIRLGISGGLAALVFYLALPYRPDISGVQVVGSLSTAAIRDIVHHNELTKRALMHREVMAYFHRREFNKAFYAWRRVRYTRLDKIIENPDGSVQLISSVCLPGQPVTVLHPSTMSGSTAHWSSTRNNTNSQSR